MRCSHMVQYVPIACQIAVGELAAAARCARVKQADIAAVPLPPWLHV